MIEKIAISKLKSNPSNPRTIKGEKLNSLIKSLKDFPEMMEARPIVANKDNIVLGGNMRLKAAKKAGLKEVPVYRAEEWTEEQEREFIIKDNVGFGEWDWDLLNAEWDKEELEEWGLNLPDEWADDKPEAKEDDFEEPDEVQTDIVLGDLFEIGPHRLLCGDSTNADDVAKLMNGEKASLEILDPLFDMDYGKIATTLPGCIAIFTRGAAGFGFIGELSKAGYGYHNLVNLTPANGVAEETLPANTHEIIHVLRKEPYFDHKIALNYCKTEGQERATSVMNHGRPTTGKNYFKYAKPVGEIAYLFAYAKSKSAPVLDLFSGSGTSFVAANKLGFRVSGMEIAPKYCQVILDRMLKIDPDLPVKRNGEAYTPYTNYTL